MSPNEGVWYLENKPRLSSTDHFHTAHSSLINCSRDREKMKTTSENRPELNTLVRQRLMLLLVFYTMHIYFSKRSTVRGKEERER